ncbi:Armadillo-like helical [Melia azedarach]|uniref:Armadillo-like helical n=1 Tax=Melia azedarach TaxID=155640 RepID=A0ACC1XAW5_MELAZ|nr:Armadillo-like helical [Melia azedarach]
MDREHVLNLLENLRKSLKDLQNNPIFTSNGSYSDIKSLLELHTKADSVFSKNPGLSKLSQLLCSIKTLLEKLEKFQDFGLKSLLSRQITGYKISQLAYSIEAEIQACIDRDSVENLVKTLLSEKEDEKVEVLIEFIKRLSKGFDSEFQDLILKAKVFSILETLLCDENCSKRVREHVALAISGLASFNRNVFVGLVLMGPTIQTLTSMDSSISIQVLCSLISLVRSPLIDEIHSRGEIPKILSLLSSENLSIRVAATDCICEIAYFGRREVIEAMLEQGLIPKLMELQRSKHKDQDGDNMENQPFANCVARFAVQVEVGEGLSSKEKEQVKLEILNRVRGYSVSEAESASIVAEVLWGSSP